MVLEEVIQQPSPVVAHVLITCFIRMHAIMQVCLVIYNTIDVSKLNIFAFALHLENKVINRSIVGINTASNSFHQLVFFFLCAVPSVDAIRTEPVCTGVCINVWNGGNENGAVSIQIL